MRVNNNELTIFQYENSPVRVVEVKGEPWFIAKDICQQLEIQNVSQAVGSLDTLNISTMYAENSRGQLRKMNIVNEAGAYELTFKSRKPKAREFQRWLGYILKKELYMRRSKIFQKKKITTNLLFTFLYPIFYCK